MIRVTGTAKLTVHYDVQLDMTEEEFDAMSQLISFELLDSTIDWQEAGRNATVDEIEVDDLVEV